MSDDKIIRDLDDADTVNDSEMARVRGEDLRRWADEARRLRTAVEAEREECVKIAERHLGQLYHGHGATGEQVIMAIISEIRGRG